MIFLPPRLRLILTLSRIAYAVLCGTVTGTPP
jgi:hypothetical protein